MKYKVEDLRNFAESLLLANGLEAEKSKAVADILLEGDLLGHTTHGLGLLAPYLAELESGKMSKEGLPEVLSDFPASMTWDGKRLPGPWLVLRAMELAIERAKTQGTCTIVIKRSHHIALQRKARPQNHFKIGWLATDHQSPRLRAVGVVVVNVDKEYLGRKSRTERDLHRAKVDVPPSIDI